MEKTKEKEIRELILLWKNVGLNKREKNLLNAIEEILNQQNYDRTTNEKIN